MIKLLLDGENDSDNLSLNFAWSSLFTIMIDYYSGYNYTGQTTAGLIAKLYSMLAGMFMSTEAPRVELDSTAA